MPDTTISPLAIVREYFPEVDDKVASSILWSRTGWPCFWRTSNVEQCLREQLKDLQHEVQSRTLEQVFARDEAEMNWAHQECKLKHEMDGTERGKVSIRMIKQKDKGFSAMEGCSDVMLNFDISKIQVSMETDVDKQTGKIKSRHVIIHGFVDVEAEVPVA